MAQAGTRSSQSGIQGIVNRAVVLALFVVAAAAPQPAKPQGAFAERIAALSEAGGYFDTDNLVSNERSYLEVIPDLKRARVAGGAYVGVGPDQNFSYIAAVRPSIAFIIDVRRDNLLLHLLFKALFQMSRTRVEYVSLLFGRPQPPDPSAWRAASVSRIVEHAAGPPATSAANARDSARIETALKRFGVPLSKDDLATIARFHQRFIEAGPDLRFQSTGRAPQPYYPTYRELLLGTDPTGSQANYLASEDGFQFVKLLEAQDLVVPVVGDLAGSSAMAAIGRLLAGSHARLSIFYASNVERYLFRDGSFERYVRNLSAIPHAPNALIIRSVFGRYQGGSTSQVQRIDDLIGDYSSGRIREYEELIKR